MTPFNDGDVDIFARILHAARYRSRRSAKRLLHESGMTHCTGTQLDEVLRFIREHPQAGEIADRAESYEAARMEAQRQAALDKMPPEGDLPQWLIGETPHWGRTFIVHLCPGGAWSFVGEVFDEPEDAPAGLERHPLDEGQWLGNITWIDGERPPEPELARLMDAARRELRKHDEQGER